MNILRALAAFALAAACAFAQPTSIPVSGTLTLNGVLDASSATASKPMKQGTSLPGACTVGDQYFKTDASAGQNLYGCTAANTWTVQAGSALPSQTSQSGKLLGTNGTSAGWRNMSGFTDDGTTIEPDGTVFAELSEDNTFTGINDFSGAFLFPRTAYASLPAAAASQYRIYTVTNCLTTACTAGGGTTVCPVISNGTSYVSLCGGSTSTGPTRVLLASWTDGSAVTTTSNTNEALTTPAYTATGVTYSTGVLSVANTSGLSAGDRITCEWFIDRQVGADATGAANINMELRIGGTNLHGGWSSTGTTVGGYLWRVQGVAFISATNVQKYAGWAQTGTAFMSVTNNGATGVTGSVDTSTTPLTFSLRTWFSSGDDTYTFRGGQCWLDNGSN